MNIQAIRLDNDGIILNKEIGGIPVIVDLINPIGKPNVRTLVKMTEILGPTIHDTANYRWGADDEMHQDYFQKLENLDDVYVGAQIFIDHDSIRQLAPVNEKMYHATDGKYGTGNSKTFGIEMCVNRDIPQVLKNTQIFCAAWFLAYPDHDLFNHSMWYKKKTCPASLLNAGKWDWFKTGINGLVNQNQSQYSDWAESSVKWMIDLGVTDGKRPQETLTREESDVKMARMLKFMGYENPYDKEE